MFDGYLPDDDWRSPPQVPASAEFWGGFFCGAATSFVIAFMWAPWLTVGVDWYLYDRPRLALS